MNKNGFTLIELLFVIVIVAAVTASSTIVFNQVTSNTQADDLKNIYSSIERAGKLYVDLNESYNNILIEKGYVTISIITLQSSNSISNKLVNPITNEKIPSYYVVKVFIKDDATLGRYVDTCIIGSDSSGQICIDDTGSSTICNNCS